MPSSRKSCTLCADDAGVGTIPWDGWSGGLYTPLDGTEVQSDDNVFAAAQPTSATTTHYLKCTDFGFAIPSGATINGFKIYTRKYFDNTVSGHQTSSTLVKMVKAGAVVGNDIGAAATWPTSETEVVYGSETELGGQTWTAAQVNASNFGVAVSATVASGKSVPTGPSHYIERVEIEVHYTLRVRSGWVAHVGISTGMMVP
jgi:hypothetical protein